MITHSAFVLYCYLASNVDGYKIVLSSMACCNETGLSRRSYQRAIDELIKYRILTYSSDLGWVFDANACAKMAQGQQEQHGQNGTLCQNGTDGQNGTLCQNGTKVCQNGTSAKMPTAKMAQGVCQNGTDLCQNGTKVCQNGTRNISDVNIEDNIEGGEVEGHTPSPGDRKQVCSSDPAGSSTETSFSSASLGGRFAPLNGADAPLHDEGIDESPQEEYLNTTPQVTPQDNIQETHREVEGYTPSPNTFPDAINNGGEITALEMGKFNLLTFNNVELQSFCLEHKDKITKRDIIDFANNYAQEHNCNVYTVYDKVDLESVFFEQLYF